MVVSRVMEKSEAAAYTNALREDYLRFRAKILNEVWEAMRDAEGGPLLDAMNIVYELTERER
jgi:hypothetical protein